MRTHICATTILVLVTTGLMSNATYARNLDVPFFSQYQCGDQLLGPSDGLISDYGCALTSVAMVFSYYGVATNPCTTNLKHR